MISGLVLQNFQGFKGPQGIRLAPITLIFGPNASGKSSISRALKLFSQSLTKSENSFFNGFDFRGPLAELGSFSQTIYGQVFQEDWREEHRILSVEVFITPRDKYYLDLVESISLEIVERLAPGELIERKGEKVLSIHGLNGEKMQIGSSDVTAKVVDPDWDVDDISVEQMEADLGIQFDEQSKKRLRQVLANETRPFANEFFSKLFITTFEANLHGEDRDYSEVLQQAEKELRQMLKSDALEHYYGFPDFTNEDEYTKILKEDEALLIQVLEYGHLIKNSVREIAETVRKIAAVESVRPKPEEVSVRPLAFENDSEQLKTLNEWMLKLTDDRYRVLIQPVQQFEGGPILAQMPFIRDELAGLQLRFDQVGTGLSQILPVILEAFSLHESKTAVTIFEEPELHLHPKMQADVMEMLVEARQLSQGQFFIETHSESMLLRLQKLIRTGVLTPEDATVVFVAPSEIIESSKDDIRYNRMRNIEFNSEGELEDPMPLSFAGLRLNDLF